MRTWPFRLIWAAMRIAAQRVRAGGRQSRYPSGKNPEIGLLGDSIHLHP